jgi:transcriptional regulator with XRE-family HTH domain
MTLKKEFGKRLQRLRKYKGFTQAQLAEAIEMSIETVSNIERGINGPSFDTLEKLAIVLKTPVYELFLFEE